MSANDQNSNSNDVEIDAPISGDASINPQPYTAKSDTSEHECSIVPGDKFLPHEDTSFKVSAVPGFLPDDRHTASLVGLRGGWRHARMKFCTRIYGSNAAVPG
ncbi:hypothetical protein TNCV_1486781 [Trichonephila clavipes]|nr:hypothetical protein TNCV_1486781 [Trichonephila clavipes]